MHTKTAKELKEFWKAVAINAHILAVSLALTALGLGLVQAPAGTSGDSTGNGQATRPSANAPAVTLSTDPAGP